MNQKGEKKTEVKGEQNVTVSERRRKRSAEKVPVGGCADTPVDVDAAGKADGKRSCLGNEQTVLSEGHGCGCQVGYLVSDGGFFISGGFYCQINTIAYAFCRSTYCSLIND